MLWTSPEVELLEHGSSESQKIIIFFPKKVVQPGALSHADTHQWQTDLDAASSQRAVAGTVTVPNVVPQFVSM